MSRIPALLLAIFLIVSCKKESNDLNWERSFGTGNAWFISPSADSGILACGTKNNNPYLIKLSGGKETETDFTFDKPGLFSSAWSDTSCFIVSGSSNGEMLLARIDKRGSKVWDTTISASFNIEYTTLSHIGSGNFLAVGTEYPDTAYSSPTGLLFIRFDTTGKILVNKEIPDANFLAATGTAIDNTGNIYLALTRRSAGAKSRASVAKYNSDIQKLWEKELYNNPGFGAACLGIISGNADSIYVTGKTEVNRQEGTLDNSFVASLSNSGITGKKKYLENSNSGTALIVNNDGLLMVLNRNCFIINTINRLSGYNYDRIRMFSVCDPYNTDAYGAGFNLDFNGNIMVAGSKGGNFYLALKSSLQ